MYRGQGGRIRLVDLYQHLNNNNNNNYNNNNNNNTYFVHVASSYAFCNCAMIVLFSNQIMFHPNALLHHVCYKTSTVF